MFSSDTTALANFFCTASIEHLTHRFRASISDIREADVAHDQVVANIISKTLNASMLRRTRARKISGNNMGKMINRKRLAAVAPSASAVSKTSVGSDFKPARRISATSGVHSPALL